MLKSNDSTPATSTNSEQNTGPEYSAYISIFIRLGFQEEAEAAAKAIAQERQRLGSFDSAQRLLRAEKNDANAAAFLASAQEPWMLSMNEFEVASFASAHGDSTPNMVDLSPETDDDTASQYYSALSITCGTETTGLQSQLGATWKHAMTRTANTGFSFGIPRSEKWKGVREGREEELGLGKMKGVGRTGKRAVPVPDAMIRAAMEQGHEEARWKTRVVDDREDTFLAHTGASFNLDACQMQEELELQIGDLRN